MSKYIPKTSFHGEKRPIEIDIRIETEKFGLTIVQRQDRAPDVEWDGRYRSTEARHKILEAIRLLDQALKGDFSKE